MMIPGSMIVINAVTLIKTNSFAFLKIDTWKMTFPVKMVVFQGDIGT